MDYNVPAEKKKNNRNLSQKLKQYVPLQILLQTLQTISIKNF